jgi:hypothetical protein
MAVIRADRPDRRICDRMTAMIRPHRRPPPGQAGRRRSDSPVSPFGRTSQPHRQESRSMIRQMGLSSSETDVEDHSMRVVEYALAFVAVLIAAILAFIR